MLPHPQAEDYTAYKVGCIAIAEFLVFLGLSVTVLIYYGSFRRAGVYFDFWHHANMIRGMASV